MRQYGQQDPALAPGTMVGEYRIEKLVGEGGMGQVYGAIHPTIGKRAAIKVLLPEIGNDTEMVERFAMEARAVNQIGHPNIVDIFAFGALPDGRQYMVMEWLKGVSLSDRLRHSTLSVPQACSILYSLAEALDAAHAVGIIHRDLKPHNVFLVDVRGKAPLVKLLDFGLVKHTSNDEYRKERTIAGAVLGTPAYMSPEQALGRQIDTRSDNYALGVMAYEMLTGRLPFMEDTAMAFLVAHMHHPASPPSAVTDGIPPELDQIVYGLMAKSPDDRPTLAQAMEVFGFFREAYQPGSTGQRGPLTGPAAAQHPSANARNASQHPASYSATHPASQPVAHMPRIVTPVPARTPTPMPTPTPGHFRQQLTMASGVMSTMGQSSGQRMPTTPPVAKGGAGKYVIAVLGIVIAAAVVVVLVVRANSNDETAIAAPVASPIAAPAIDAAAAAVVPPPDAAAIAASTDAAVVVPADAAVVAVTPDAAAPVVDVAGTRKDKKRTPKRSPEPATTTTTTTTPTPTPAVTPPPPKVTPPPKPSPSGGDDDDALIPVSPKKK